MGGADDDGCAGAGQETVRIAAGFAMVGPAQIGGGLGSSSGAGIPALPGSAEYFDLTGDSAKNRVARCKVCLNAENAARHQRRKTKFKEKE